MTLGISIVVGEGTSADPALGAATAVEVHERAGEVTTYSIRFPLDIREGDIPLLGDARLEPGSVLSLFAPIEGASHCLVKGPVTGQQIRLSHSGGDSWLEVQGADQSIVMDREVKAIVWSDGKDSDAVSTIVSGYGFTPDVAETSGAHAEAKHSLVQRDTDLRFVRRLARRNGFHFWVTADATGVQTAHFKRPPLDVRADKDLVINLPGNNLQTLDLRFDVERPTSVEAAGLDLGSKGDLDGGVPKTPLELLGAQGLKDITGDARTAHVAAPADDADGLRARGEGALIEADWFIRASCETTVQAVGALLRASTTVELRGAGSRHSGRYFIAGVRHSIEPTGHKMTLELCRNGWGA